MRVIESTTIGAGYAALSMMDTSSDDVDAIVEDLRMAMDGVITAQISHCVRDAVIDNVEMRVGLIATGIMIVLLLTTKYMSLSTTVAMLLCPILLIPFGASAYVILMAAACAVFMAVRHKENFVRLLKGNESKFSIKGKK